MRPRVTPVIAHGTWLPTRAKTIKFQAAVWALLFVALMLPGSSTAQHQLELVSANNQYRLRDQVSGKTLLTTASADQAFGIAKERLGQVGGLLRLTPGRYVLTQPVALGNETWLQGSGRSTVLYCRQQGGLLMRAVRGAIVSDLTLLADSAQRPLVGVQLNDAGECQVRNVRVQGFADYGIYLKNNTFLNELAHCWVADNRKANIFLEDLAVGSRGGDFVQNEIKNCTTVRGGNGIETSNAIVVNVVGCSVFQPSGHAYFVRKSSNSVLISGSRSFQVEGDAVVVENSHEINLSSNIFCWHRGHGIVLRGANWGTVSGNNVIDSGVRTRDGSLRTGIVVEKGCKGLQITSNAVFNWGDQMPMAYGITEDNTGENNLIAQNNINYFTQVGVQAAGQGTVVTNNVTAKDRAYQGMGKKGYPDFDTKKIDQFLH